MPDRTVSKPRRKSKKRKLPPRVEEWNLRALLDIAGSKRPERYMALAATELNRCNIDVAGGSKNRLASYDSTVVNDTQSS